MKRVAITGIRQPIVFDKQHDCPFEKPFGYIYRVTNKINGHMYIGKHVYNKPYMDKRYHGSGIRLNKAYEKYGMENFTMEILEWVGTNDDDLNEAEIKWIDAFDTFNNREHYNMTHGGDGNAMHGVNHPNYGKTGCKNPNYGNHYSEESRRLMSKNHYDCSGKNNPNYGKHHSEDVRKKIGEVHSGKKLSKEHILSIIRAQSGKNNHCSRSIVQLDNNLKLIRKYDFIRQSTVYGFNEQCVGDCCRGKQKTHKGYKWMYKEDYEAMIQQREAQ